MLQLLLEGIVAFAINVKLSVLLRNLDFKRKMLLRQSVSFVGMVHEGSVGITILESLELWNVTNSLVKFVDAHLNQAMDTRLELAGPDPEWFVPLNLLFQSICHGVLVAVLKLAILDPDGMYH